MPKLSCICVVICSWSWNLVADNSCCFRGTAVVNIGMGAGKEACLVPQAPHIVHCIGAWDLSKVGPRCGNSICIPQHPWHQLFEYAMYLWLTKPADDKSVICPMQIVTDRFSADKDVSFMRSRSSHQLHLWQTCLSNIFTIFTMFTCNAAICSWIRLAPEIPAVVVSTKKVLNALIVTVTVALSVGTGFVPAAEGPVSGCSSSNGCRIPTCNGQDINYWISTALILWSE